MSYKYRKKGFPTNTRIPKWFQSHVRAKYKCSTCLDTGKCYIGVCPDCDPTTPDKEELDV